MRTFSGNLLLLALVLVIEPVWCRGADESGRRLAVVVGNNELVIERDNVKSKKIISLDRPTALAFDNEGALYVAVFVTGEETGDKPAGGMLRLTPGL